MEQFRDYFIKPVKKIGSGAFGYVEEIELYNINNNFCGKYAKKTLSPESSILANISMDEIKRRFIREVIYQSECTHKNIINIHLFNKSATKPYFIMDIGTSDLQAEIDSGRLIEDNKIQISLMILHAVMDIHNKGYLHRDIKPHNILKFSDSEYKISDFGLAKSTDENKQTTVLTAIGVTMGTRKYMAPEILYDAEYSIKTDIYAIGKVMEDLNISDKNFQRIVSKCVNREKDQRYVKIDDIINDISSINFSMAG